MKHAQRICLVALLVLVFAAHSSADTKVERYELQGKMNIFVDEVEGIKWFKDKTSPNILLYEEHFYVYLGQKHDIVWPRFVLGIYRNKWVFFENVIFSIDGRRRELSLNYFDIKRESTGNGVKESIDINASDHIHLLKEIAESTKTIVRCKGNHGSHDFEVSKKQKDAMKRVLRLYELMK